VAPVALEVEKYLLALWNITFRQHEALDGRRVSVTGGKDDQNGCGKNTVPVILYVENSVHDKPSLVRRDPIIIPERRIFRHVLDQGIAVFSFFRAKNQAPLKI
jgi:hypothetical protein